MVEKFKKDRDPQGYNVVILDCETDEVNYILEQILSFPFLSEKKLIVLKNLLSATKKVNLQENILARIKEKTLPESNNYIFWEGEGKLKTNVAKEMAEILSQEKFSQNFEELKGIKLSAWIKQEITEHQGKIDRSALEYLINNATDTWRLNTLIEQLIAYKKRQTIQLADVELFLNEKIDNNIFNLVDAIVAKQSKQVYKMIREQYRLGEDSQYIFAMILRQFKILLELRDLFEREDKLTSDQIAKQLNLHPFVVKKSLPLVKRYTMAELKNIYKQLLEIDVKTKTGQGDQSLLLDLFVGKLTT